MGSEIREKNFARNFFSDHTLNSQAGPKNNEYLDCFVYFPCSERNNSP